MLIRKLLLIRLLIKTPSCNIPGSPAYAWENDRESGTSIFSGAALGE